MTSIRITVPVAADWPVVQRIDELAFGYSWAPDMEPALELARALVAHVDDEAAGLAAALTFDLAVPGGRLPAAGVTWVGVIPTHRRRGVLTALMRRQLDDVRAAGEPVAVLWASEPVIYGRYGYGLASRRLSVTVPRAGTVVDGPVDDGLRLRLVPPADGLAAVEDVYAAVRAARPGMPLRVGEGRARALHDPPSQREGASELRCALAEDADGVRGYTLFATRPSWHDGSASGTVRVRELLAVDPAAHAACWRFLLGIDLMDRVVHINLAEDDPVLHLLADPRRAQPVLQDALFVRLVDLPAALTGRRYAVHVDVVLEVSDAFAPWNAGRWRLRADAADGATCERTDDPADLVLDVRELGAAFLGGTSLTALAAAGRVVARSADALTVATAAFRHDPLPYCPFIF